MTDIKEIIYEDEMEDIFLYSLQKKYSTNNNILSFDEVYEIFLMRYLTYNDYDTKIKDINKFLYSKIDELILFIKRELNLPNNIIYKGTHISNIYNNSNSINNIITSIIFQFGENKITKVNSKILSKNDMIYFNYIQMYKKIYKTLKIPKRHTDFKYFLKFELLQNLYREYKFIPINFTENIENIYYMNNFEIKNSIDEEILDKINTSDISKTEKLVKEKEIEKYYIKNIHLINENLKIIKNQYKLEHGIIDILAKDNNDILYVIEIKTKRDKRLSWQLVYYYNSIKKIFNTNKVKCIVVSPNLSKDMIETLKFSISDLEFFEIDKKLLYKK